MVTKKTVTLNHCTKETALKSLPKGWVKLENATTAPRGYYWASNGKSLFGGEYKHALIWDKKYWDYEKTLEEKEMMKKHSSKKTKKTAAKTQAKLSDYKSRAAPKKRTARQLKADAARKAKLPGKRVSATGRVYYEKRANRSDTAKERRTHGKKSIKGR